MMQVSLLIVTYEPDLILFREHLSRNSSSSSCIIIVDNSCTPESISFVRSLSRNNIIVVQNFKNLGIAEAQNIGIELFLKLGGEYLLQLDQDSSIEKSDLKLLLNFYDANRVELNLAGVGPCPTSSEIREVREMKSSGLLLHRSIIECVGSMRSDLFIDLVDYEWCWRARAVHKLSFYQVPCSFFHQLGTDYFIFGLFLITIPSPVRHYYQTRNSLILVFSGDAPLAWSLNRMFIMAFKLIFYPFLLPSGWDRFKYMILGFKHFFLRKTGGLY